MRRLFISLYVVVAAATVCCVLLVPWLINSSLRSPFKNYGEQLAAAPQFLFEQALQDVPREQWSDAIRQLQSHFGYEVTLKSIEEVTSDEPTRSSLRRGLATVPPQKSDDLLDDAMLLPLRGSNQVVTIHFSETPTERAERGLGGIYFLLDKYLARLPVAERPAELARLGARFGIPLRYLQLAETALPPDMQQRLREHRVVGVDLDKTSERYYQLLQDDSAVIQIGALPVPGVLPYAQTFAYVSIALVFALAIFLWIRPLWHDMRKLDQRAAEFGTGDLSARVEVSGASAIYPLARTFNGMADRVQALITAQRELMHGVSHELRTPLARLRFAADLMTPESNAADRVRLLAGMREDIRELDELVDETLTYARLTSAGAVTMSLETVDIAALIDEAIQVNQRLPAPVQIKRQFNQQTCIVQADRRQLARALQNLLRNAVQHAHSQVLVVVGNVEGRLCIQVDDDGPGVPVAARETIFQPFHRLDGSRSRDTGGYGLGLAIARRIFDLHSAELTVSDSPLGGARFEARFSAQTATQA